MRNNKAIEASFLAKKIIIERLKIKLTRATTGNRSTNIELLTAEHIYSQIR